MGRFPYLHPKAPSWSRTEKAIQGNRLPAWVWAWSAVLLLGGLIFVLTAMQSGAVAAVRSGVDLLTPVGAVWLSLAGTTVYWVARGKKKQSWTLGGLFLAWTCVGNTYFANELMGLVEPELRRQPHPALELRSIEAPLDVIVISGGFSLAKFPGFYEIGEDGERIVSAAQAWHANAARYFVVTGSSTNSEDPPRVQGAALLQSLGVPADRIFQVEGVNTRAEMKSLAAWIASPPRSASELAEKPVSQWKIGLITSGFHMPRAMRLASNENLRLIPLPCAFRNAQTTRELLVTDVIPRSDNLKSVDLAVKEIIAFLVGQ